MLELSDLVVSLIIGLAAPLAILDSTRLLFDGLIPEQGLRQDGQGRLRSWLLALVAGPALYVERVIADVKSGELRGGQIGLSIAAVLSWSCLYGLALSGLLKQIQL
jgi:hypothetical protein